MHHLRSDEFDFSRLSDRFAALNLAGRSADSVSARAGRGRDLTSEQLTAESAGQMPTLHGWLPAVGQVLSLTTDRSEACRHQSMPTC